MAVTLRVRRAAANDWFRCVGVVRFNRRDGSLGVDSVNSIPGEPDGADVTTIYIFEGTALTGLGSAPNRSCVLDHRTVKYAFEPRGSHCQRTADVNWR